MKNKIDFPAVRIVATHYYKGIKMAAILSGLMELRNMIDQVVEKSGLDAKDLKALKGLKLNKSGKPRKVSNRKGRPVPHGDFVKKICKEHSEEIAAFKAANPDTKSPHLVYVANYKKQNPEMYAAFEAAWKEEHPKKVADASEGDSVDASENGSVAEGGSIAEGGSVASSSKPKRVLTDEHKAAMKAGREAAAAKKRADIEVAAVSVGERVEALEAVQKKPKKVAKKAITTEVVAPVEVNTVEELLPFTYNGNTYLRMGTQRPNGNHLWTSGHMWMSKKGQKGHHYGELQEDGTIDMNADEPEISC